jgi:hypothetical protein
MKVQKRPDVFNAVQWFKDGDHPLVIPAIRLVTSEFILGEWYEIFRGAAGAVPTFVVVTGIEHYVNGTSTSDTKLAEVKPGYWIITGESEYPVVCAEDEFKDLYMRVA